MKKEQLYYALRNITRKKKQTLFAVLCISVSSFVIFSNISLNNGIQAKLREGINEVISGEYLIYSADGLDVNILESQLNEQRVFEAEALTNDLRAANPEVVINKRVRFGSLVSFDQETSYLNVHALEKGHLERLGNLLSLGEGRLPGNEKEIVISQTMSDDLKCGLGDTLLLVATNLNDYMSDEIAVVSGIFQEKGLALYLSYNAFVPYDFGKELVQLDDSGCLELVLNPKNGASIPEKEMAAIRKLVGGRDKDLKIARWEKTVPLLFAVTNVWQGCGYMTQFVFVVFSLIILVNLTSLVIRSRRKEFGTLLAMGFSWRKVNLLVCLEYLLLTAIAFALGYLLFEVFLGLLPDASLGIPDKDMQYALMTDSIRFFLDAGDVFHVLFLFLATITGAVFISLGRIRRINPNTLINAN